MKNFKNKTKNSGYAILFAVVIVSVISLISFGLSNTTYKQLILSSLAGDSQTAYLQSDMGTECSLYADNIVGMVNLPASWNCGVDSNGNPYSFSVTNIGGVKYIVAPVFLGVSSSCFEFDVDKSISNATTIKARGYNICDKSNSKTVEREIQVTY